jgi:nicotinate-nucleotide adenylyltransferase
VLSATPPHKATGTQAPIAHRRRMLELAVADNPQLRPSKPASSSARALVLDRHDPRSCKRARPTRSLTFILGADAFAEIATWKDYARFFSSVTSA